MQLLERPHAGAEQALEGCRLRGHLARVEDFPHVVPNLGKRRLGRRVIDKVEHVAKLPHANEIRAAAVLGHHVAAHHHESKLDAHRGLRPIAVVGIARFNRRRPTRRGR